MMLSITALYRIADPDDRRTNKTAVTDQSSIVIAANLESPLKLASGTVRASLRGQLEVYYIELALW
jgi:hypothetical protein